MDRPPTLVIVSGPPGTGKTTLAHRLAEADAFTAIGSAEGFESLAMDAPTLAVDTTDGYDPPLDEIRALVDRRDDR